MSIGIKLGAHARLGDKLIFTALPENYYLNTGKKLIDLNNSFVFDYNPFVIRDKSAVYSHEVDLWQRFQGLPDAISLIHKTCKIFDLKCYLNHPRLYAFENNHKTYKSLCVHTTGHSLGAIPRYIINYIREKYSDFFTYHVGSQGDVDVGLVIDKRGCPFWETAKTIAESEIFIGIDSAPMWIALCYPRTRIKIILIEKSEKELESWLPLPKYGWPTFNCEFYNTFGHDIGITRSYLKI